MSVILRIDVDWSYQNRILNYARVNQELFLAVDYLGYLKSCKKIVDDLNDRGIKASAFFQPATVPNKKFAQSLADMGHSVGLHAVHTKSYDSFLSDLNKISKKFDGLIRGFTKHGSGTLKFSRRHDSFYDPERYIEYAKKSGLKYFLGNREKPMECGHIINNILYFPSAFWLNRNYREDKFTVEWLIDESNNRDVVVLIHPEDITEGTLIMQREYERILGGVEKFKTIDEIIRTVEK